MTVVQLDALMDMSSAISPVGDPSPSVDSVPTGSTADLLDIKARFG